MELPLPIHRVAQRYFIYDLDHMLYLRKEHRILGLLVGTLPQSPQQNVFFGLPNQLLPEEARLLVEQGICYVVDDRRTQSQGLKALDADLPRRRKWLDQVKETGLQAALERDENSKQKKEEALGKMSQEKREAVIKSLDGRTQATKSEHTSRDRPPFDSLNQSADDSETLFPVYDNAADSSKLPVHDSSSSSQVLSISGSDSSRIAFPVTPTTSYPPLEKPKAEDISEPLPKVPDSYPLYKYLHSEYPSSNYFMTPGLRFGCQYSVYPGDPLRYHSHFLALSREWDEEIDLMALVGGGRLGTGVKKGYLLGGVERKSDDQGQEQARVRCFSIEWGGM